MKQTIVSTLGFHPFGTIVIDFIYVQLDHYSESIGAFINITNSFYENSGVKIKFSVTGTGIDEQIFKFKSFSYGNRVFVKLDTDEAIPDSKELTIDIYAQRIEAVYRRSLADGLLQWKVFNDEAIGEAQRLANLQSLQRMKLYTRI